MGFGGTLARPRSRKVLAFAAGALALYAGLGFLVLPAVLRPVAERKLAEALHRPVTLRRLAFDPFSLTATLDGLDVKEKGGAGPFLSFDRLRVNLQAASLVAGGPVIREITLIRPSVTLVRREDGTYNVQDLLDDAMKPSKKEAPLRFSVNNIRLEDGSLDLDDRPKRTAHRVRGLRIGIPFLSNIPSRVEISTLPALEANVNGAPFALHGKTKPFSGTHETSVDVDLHDVDLPHYLAYAPAMPVTITSGRLDARLTIAFEEIAKGPSKLTVSGTAALGNLATASGSGPLLAWERLEATLASVDVFGRKARLDRLTVSRPEVWIRREKEGKEGTAASASPPAPQPGGAPAPFLVEIGALGITAGKAHYDDAAAPFHATLGDVALSVKGLSTAPGAAAPFEASATSDAGETATSRGTVSMEPFGLEGELDLGGVPLKRYLPYLKTFVAFTVDDGVLGLKTKLRFASGPGGGTSLSDLSAELRSPRLRKPGEKEPFFRAPSVSLTGTSLDLGKRELAAGELSSGGGFLALVREKDGSADLAKLVGGAPAGSKRAAPPAPPSPPWTITAKKLRLDGYTVKVEDRATRSLARYAITRLSLVLDDVSTARGARSSLSTRFGIDGKGVATARGPVGVGPVFADLSVGVKGLDLVPLEPYVLASLRLSLARGTLSGAGTLSFREGADGNARVTYAGSAALDGVTTIEPDSKLDFVRWDSLSARGLKAGYNPMFVEAAALDVAGLACDVSIEADGTLNLRRVLGAPAPPEDEEAADEGSPEAPPAPAPTPLPADAPKDVLPIRIDVLTLKGGRVGLADRLVTPGYSGTLASVEGRVSGLSSQPGTVAQLDVRGSLANHSPLEITGSVNPLAATAFADVKASFRNVDLPPFTPYSGKYVGYGLSRGTLTMEVAYKLENRKLTAQNRFLVDGLELGEKVESKDATKLPVKLAISLLKDRNGLIDLDLPIEGSLDDPKFRIGKILWKVLGNLIGKAVTAPFALLGKLFGGGAGQDLSSIDFAAGRDALDDAARARLDALAKALADRPALKLDVTGRFSGDGDLEALRRLRFERKLKAQKLADLVKAGRAPASVDDVVVEEKEYATYLTRAYKKEKIEKPRNALGIARSLPATEMEALMLANVTVTGSDLRQLALARANAAKDQLTGPLKVDAARVFVLEPLDAPAEPKEKAAASRADFSLR